MKSKSSLLLVGIFGMAATGVAAAAAQGWSGEGELGIVTTSGNTKNKTINAKAKAGHESQDWRHGVQLEAYNSADADRTTAERYLAAGKSDYKLSDVDYVFGMLTYENDRYAGFDYRISEVLGYGRKVIQQPTMSLDLEAGPGARQTKLIDGTRNDEFIVRVGGEFKWKLSDMADFTETASADIGEDSTIIKSVTALKAKVSGALAMKLAYTVRNNSEVAIGTKKTDTETALTLVYGF